MGNRRNRDPRCKRSNNWKVTKKIRDEKKNILNSSNNEYTVPPQSLEPSGNHEPLESDTLRVDTPHVLEDQPIDYENEDAQGNFNIPVKRRRMTSRKDNSTIVPETENYYELLSETDDDYGNENISINDIDEHKRADPLFIDPMDNDYAEDGEEEFSEEEDYDLNFANDEGNDVDNADSQNDVVTDEDTAESIDNRSDLEDENLSNGDEEVILEENISGRRLFEAAGFFQRLKQMGRHSKNCTFDDMVVIGESKRGLTSTLKFQCKKCGAIRKFQLNPRKPHSLNLNEDAILGINAIGSGLYHLQEFCSNINVPCMGNTMYDSISKKQQSDWFCLAHESAASALQEEIELAIAAGVVDELGNALIAVICDGGWGRRSYGKNFNSLSGCAVLIGVRTKKVLFFGVRNKYCHICKIAESKTTPVKEHECNINYSGPSSGMEADIILEGFKSCESFGARFHKLIADGDSNTYKTLRDFRIYKDPDLVIEKLECVNHLCRNFRSKFSNLQSITKFDCTLRRHVKPSKGNDICKGVKAAANHWIVTNLPVREKINNLEADIMNAPLHYFGVHTNCKSYFCTKTTEKAALDNLKLLKDDGLFYEVMNLCQVYFAGNAKSLLENHTNNAAEQFNNIVAKYLGGKRINYSLARSYTARVASAVVQYNSGGHAASQFRKFKFGSDHECNTEKLEFGRKRKVKANAVALNTKPRIRHKKGETKTGSYFHREGFEDLDMEPEKYEKCKKIFWKKIVNRQKNRKQIEADTVDKKLDSYWHVIRQDLLPSSHFHMIIKAIKRESFTNILKEIMYIRSELGNNAQIKHQRLVQRDALAVFENLFEDEIISECGIFIDKNLPFLGATPFRLCGNDHILSIKCPVKLYNQNFDRAIEKINFFKRNKNGEISINEKSDWFIELQGEMHVTNRNHAHLMIWLGESSYRVIEVHKSNEFFQTKMKEKLTYFYKEVMLKELVDSRVGRHMELRKYDAEKLSFL